MKIIRQVKHKLRCFFDVGYRRYWQAWIDLFTPRHTILDETKQKPEQSPESPFFDDELKAYEYTINDATTIKPLKLVHYVDLARWPQNPAEINRDVQNLVDLIILNSPEYRKQVEYYKDHIIKDLCEWLYNAKIGAKR
jgi:hypothetical protein